MIDLSDDDLRARKENGVPAIDFSDRVKFLMAQSLKRTVIIRLLGKRISYKTLCAKIEDLWRPSHGYKITDLDNEYYLVRFDNKEDYTNALVKG